MELWAARDRNGNSNIYEGDPEWLDDVSGWRADGVQVCDKSLSDLACRDVNPGEKRKLKVFDPINEIVEYEESLEVRYQRLVDAVKAWGKRPYGDNSEFNDFLRSEGYVN